MEMPDAVWLGAVLSKPEDVDAAGGVLTTLLRKVDVLDRRPRRPAA